MQQKTITPDEIRARFEAIEAQLVEGGASREAAGREARMRVLEEIIRFGIGPCESVYAFLKAMRESSDLIGVVNDK